ncbi:hypothetical protein V6N13_081499 [Hibiscus sabdariffa]
MVAVGSRSSDGWWRFGHVATPGRAFDRVEDSWAREAHRGEGESRVEAEEPWVGAERLVRVVYQLIWTVGSHCDPTVKMGLCKRKEQIRL